MTTVMRLPILACAEKLKTIVSSADPVCKLLQRAGNFITVVMIVNIFRLQRRWNLKISYNSPPGSRPVCFTVGSA